MSKPSSGYFSGTLGYKASKSISTNDKKPDKIKDKLDLREHPTKYKQLSSKKLKQLRKKEANRTITKKEYKQKEWQKRLNKRRQTGIDDFWHHEKFLIETKSKTTRAWSAEQRTDILNNKKPKFEGSTMHSHHTYSVAKYPHLANIGSLIYPATSNEHRNGWHGGNYRNSLPGVPIKNIKDF